MKNLKTGNILLIALGIIMVLFILNGGLRQIKDILTEDIKEQLAEKDKQLTESVKYSEQLKDSIKSMHIQLKDSIKSMHIQLKDSIKSMHISYMNNSYLKENYDEDATYWFVRHEHSKFSSQNIIKLDGPLSPVDLINKIYKHDKVSGFVGLRIMEQVSEKEYYKWLEFEALDVNYVPY